MSPIVGVVLMLGLVCGQAAVAVAMMWQPDTVERRQLDATREAVTYCEGHQFQYPACDNGKPLGGGEEGVWCRPLFEGQEHGPLKCFEVHAAVLVRCVRGVTC